MASLNQKTKIRYFNVFMPKAQNTVQLYGKHKNCILFKYPVMDAVVD